MPPGWGRQSGLGRGGGVHNSISGGEFQNVFMAHTINVAEPPAPAERVILMDVPVIRHYVNNHELFTRMDTIRAGCRAEDVATRILLWGMPGIGVTAAADRWVREHQTDLPTIQLRAELSPNGQHADATAVLEDWLDQLGVPKQDRPGDQAALARCFQRRTAGLPVLVLIDGARTAAQVRPLLPGSRRSIALITSHDRLGGLRGSHDVEQLRVGPLDDEHSDALLARVADLGDETKAARLPLVRACAGIPLALRILAARLVSLGRRRCGSSSPNSTAAHRAWRNWPWTTSPSPACSTRCTGAWTRTVPAPTGCSACTPPCCWTKGDPGAPRSRRTARADPGRPAHRQPAGPPGGRPPPSQRRRPRARRARRPAARARAGARGRAGPHPGVLHRPRGGRGGGAVQALAPRPGGRLPAPGPGGRRRGGRRSGGRRCGARRSGGRRHGG